MPLTIGPQAGHVQSAATDLACPNQRLADGAADSDLLVINAIRDDGYAPMGGPLKHHPLFSRPSSVSQLFPDVPSLAVTPCTDTLGIL